MKGNCKGMNKKDMTKMMDKKTTKVMDKKMTTTKKSGKK